MSRGDGPDRPAAATDRPADATAGAWAAAAIVLALGALVFGVVAELHAHDLDVRVTRLEQAAKAPPTTAAGNTAGATSTTAALAPADPAKAEAAIDAAFTTVYDGSQPMTARLSFIDDPDGVMDAFERATTGSLGAVTGDLRADVSRVTFTSSVTATVAYSITASGTTAERLGSAREVDGTWKVSRSTVCSDLSAAGVACSS